MKKPRTDWCGGLLLLMYQRSLKGLTGSPVKLCS